MHARVKAHVLTQGGAEAFQAYVFEAFGASTGRKPGINIQVGGLLMALNPHCPDDLVI